MYSIRSVFRRALSSPCPLCGLGARGGDLCDGCQQELMPHPDGHDRCRQCGAYASADAPAGAQSNAQTDAQTDAQTGVQTAAQTHKQTPTQAHTFGGPCRACRAGAPAYDQTVVAIDYAFPGDMLVRALKERGRLELAGLFGRMIWQGVVARENSLPALDLLIPGPSSVASLGRRGFNPAAEITRQIARQGGLPIRRDWLRRTRESALQKALGATDRKRNVQGLYAAPDGLPAVCVGLVDDVMTTGSTMHQAALALRSGGVAAVVALVGARTPVHATAHVWQNGDHV